ncbi:MAG: methylated-DNA--[protein]-cysteine S-methyltransferase [Methanomassiliicoccales archaeon]
MLHIMFVRSSAVNRAASNGAYASIRRTSMGFLGICGNGKGVCHLTIKDSRSSVLQELRSHHKLHNETNVFMEKWCDRIASYIDGERNSVGKVPLNLSGTSFQRRVWNEIASIPPGTTISYLELARRVRSSAYARAVARACGDNPVPVLIPCHRVISSSGGLGGFGLGLDKKRMLLRHEGIDV